MSTSTSTTGKTTDSTVRRGLRTGEQVVAVQFGAWGPQEVAVRAYSEGGRGGAPYVVVVVGGCLTYVYDRAAVDCHVLAWQDAEQVNRSVRLPDFTPATATRRHAGEDVSVFSNVHGEQRRNVTSSTGADGRPVLTVTVGAVTVDVHTTTALRSFLAAWRKAATVTGMLEGARNDA